jgi:hypothetical protein
MTQTQLRNRDPVRYALADINQYAGTFEAQRILMGTQFRQRTMPDVTGPGIVVENLRAPIIAGLDRLIGHKLYVYIARDDSMNYIAYLAPEKVFLPPP